MTVVFKQPAEKLVYAFLFGDKIDDDTVTISTISTLTGTAVGLVEGSAALTLTGQAIVGQTVQVFIAGGTSGEDYALLCRITDSDGQIHEGDATLRVAEEEAQDGLVVEDGSIVAGANSYADVATADAYLRLRARATTWDTLDQATKAGRLVMASAYLDAKMDWLGDIADADQTMQWPRSGATDRNGNSIDSDTVPTQVVHATIEVAVVGDFVMEASRVTSAEQVGSISVQYASGDPTQTAARYSFAMSLLTGLARSGQYSSRVVRA